MAQRLVSVGDNFTLPSAVKATDDNLPPRLGAAALSSTFAEVVSLAGDGIDPTGATYSTAAIQKKLSTAANKDVYLPPGTYKVSGTITIPGERTRLSGPGVLSWGAGIENAPAIRITGQGVTLDGITMRNPLELGAITGTSSPAVQIHSHDVTIVNCLIDSFQGGILVFPDGEWVHTIIANNRIKDVLGSGEGVGNITSDRGEDRGDGIMTAGASASITGNVINAKAGRDARIGIHCEALTPIATNHPVGEDRTFTITGNVVTGPFRRSIATEDVSNATVSGNAVADATWWGISVSGACHNVTVSGNSLLWTLPAGRVPGLAYGPDICCFYILNEVKGMVLSDNVVTVSGQVTDAVFITGSTARGFPKNISVTGNVIQTPSGGRLTNGVRAIETGTGDLVVAANTVEGFTRAGIEVTGASTFSVTNNSINGVKAGVAGQNWGILADGVIKGGVIANNRVANVAVGVERANGKGGTIITANQITGAGAAIDLYATTAPVVTSNAFIGCKAGISNAGSDVVSATNVTIA